MDHFLAQLDSIYDNAKEKLYGVAEMNLTEDDQLELENATTCSICLKDLNIEGLGPVVADHNHVSGNFRGAAHSWCNLQMKQEKHIIIYMHNAKG